MTPRPTWNLALALALGLGARPSFAQEPTIEPGLPAGPAATGTSLGPIPGSGGSAIGNQPGASDAILGGRPGPSVPRVPSTITQPGQGFGAPPRMGISPPPPVPITEVPLYGPLAVPTGPEVEGPPGGLTLDQAIDRLVHENISLRSRFLEIPKAQADVLTASLRANPILFADAQQVPYGSFAEEAGPTQYDLNITYPLDLSGKRQARTTAAGQTRRVLEAQYQDAVRIEIANLSTAFLQVLAERETLRYARTSAEGLADLLEKTRVLLENEAITEADYLQIANQLEAARIGAIDAEELLRDAKRTLGGLLTIPPEQAEAMEVRGTIHDLAPPPAPVETLTRMALDVRPDLVAIRRGIALAGANVDLALANRYSDVYLLYQPYTYQKNSSLGTGNSWAVGLTVPLPLYNRNQGNIQRARISVQQVKLDLADRERQVVIEVRRASREYAVTRAAVERVERALLPSAGRVLDTAVRQLELGEIDALAYLNAQRAYNDVVRQYRDTLVRHRRGMFALNTAVGRRIVP